jgi:arsenate reductase-like glutaredoxin family protein
MMMEDRPGEITLIFHSDKEEDRRMRDYVEAIDSFEVNPVDLKTERLSEEDLEGIADKLDVEIPDLLDPTYAALSNIDVKSLSKENALNLLARNTALLSTPVIVIGEHAYQFESSSELIIERKNED